jgi:type VI secretion system protein ImpK
MRNAKNVFNETFGTFCLQLFDGKKSAADSDADYKTLHKSLSFTIKASLESEKNSPFVEDAKDVVYAMAVLADEIFLSVDWSGKQYWEENMLERLYFGSQIAGERIFDKINEFTLKSESVEKAEIYLKLLSLGFKGRYRGSDDEESEINAYKDKLYKFIEKRDKSVFLIGHRLFQKEYSYTIPTIHRKFLPDGAIISYVCSFFVFMFLVISSAVWVFETRDIKRLLNEISHIALRE